MAEKKKLEELGVKFCDTLTEMEVFYMNKFIEQYKKGEAYKAYRALESLDFVHTVGDKICRIKEEE